MISSTDTVYFLLVDDIEENLIALEALLRRPGLVLLKARSGPLALEFLLKHEIALALVDVQMPGMDGFELAEVMRGTERTRRVPIIFLTAGTADRQRRFRGYEAGAVDFLHKPIETDVLKNKADVFFELYRQQQEVARQRDELRAAISENSRLLEESQQYARALQESDRRKDEFLATLAHELRNPLAPIRSAIQVLRTMGAPDPRFQEIQSVVERQVNHLVRLVDDLMDVRRISEGKLDLHLEQVDLGEILQFAVETSHPIIQAARHQFQVDLPSEPLMMKADPVRLTQVVANLLNNAAKYTPEGGEIHLTATADGPAVVIRVRDNGMGIPAEMQHRVFELFTQVNRHLKRSQGGLGIGLNLVRRLVEMHGGTIAAHSAGDGQGAEFTVRLPLDAEASPLSLDPDPEPAVAQSVSRRILVVDDNTDAAMSLSMLLSLYGHTVRTAHDGIAGIEIAQAFQPELILLDLGMPRMDGFETARRLRQMPELNATRLVALTGWGQEKDRQRTKEAGFAIHLVKPIDPAKVRELLEGIGSHL